jgi:hypothetical protein
MPSAQTGDPTDEMKEIVTREVALPVETVFGILYQLGDGMNWQLVRADVESCTIVWKHDRGTSVVATLESYEGGTRVTLVVDRFGAFDPFRHPSSILEPMLLEFYARTKDHLFAIKETQDMVSSKQVCAPNLSEVESEISSDLKETIEPSTLGNSNKPPLEQIHLFEPSILENPLSKQADFWKFSSTQWKIIAVLAVEVMALCCILFLIMLMQMRLP